MTTLLNEIKKLTVDERLDMLGQIWNDLASMPDQVTSPAWHEEELNHREKRIKSGEATFSDWDEARDRIVGRVT